MRKPNDCDAVHHRSVAAGRRQPEDRRCECGQGEDREGLAPAVVEEVLEGHRRGRRGRRAERQGHREGAGQAAAVAGEADPDQRRHDCLGNRHGRAGEERPGEQPGDAAEPADTRTDRGERRARRQQPLDRDPPDERGSERCEQAEAEQRQRRQQAGCGRGEAEVGTHVFEQRRQAREDRAQVRSEQDDRDEEQDPGRARCPVCWNSVVVRHGVRLSRGGGQPLRWLRHATRASRRGRTTSELLRRTAPG